MKPSSPRRTRASRLALFLSLLLPAAAFAQSSSLDVGKQLLREYAGNDNWRGLLHHPKVWPQLQKLLGPQLAHLQANLDVSGAVDVDGGDLTVRGNATHQGGEEEAVVCVNTYNLDATAAIHSKGTITVFSRAKSYEELSRCIRDWITLVNSGRRDLTYQPRNVRLAASAKR